MFRKLEDVAAAFPPIHIYILPLIIEVAVVNAAVNHLRITPQINNIALWIKLNYRWRRFGDFFFRIR